jgi:hypothetical protein
VESIIAMPILKSVSYSSSNLLGDRNGDYIFDGARSAGPYEVAYNLVARGTCIQEVAINLA